MKHTITKETYLKINRDTAISMAFHHAKANEMSMHDMIKVTLFRRSTGYKRSFYFAVTNIPTPSHGLGHQLQYTNHGRSLKEVFDSNMEYRAYYDSQSERIKSSKGKI